ncbi:MAG: hypothetical protein WC052_01800 [Patescibacteria group bacterium]
MRQFFVRFLGAILASITMTLAPAPASAGAGSQIALLSEFCLYPDCGARLAYTSHEWGWANPATLTETFDLGLDDWASVGGAYFYGSTIYSGTITAGFKPVVVQLNYVNAAVDGELPSSDLDLAFETSRWRLSLAWDLASVGIDGLSIGVIGVLPGSENKVGISTEIPDFGDLDLVKAHEEPGWDFTLGMLYEMGERDWLRFGATLNVASYDSSVDALDLDSGEVYRTNSTSNLWFGRLGATVHPFVPMGLASGESSWDEWLRKVEISADLRVVNISISGEDTIRPIDAFFGVDVPLLPRHWNPLAKYVELVGVSGVGTDGSWGAGLGIYGQGPLRWLTCDTMYSSQPGGDLGKDFTLSGIGCTASMPLPF